ncbi:MULTISPECIES: VasL domain-containing protein [Lelliottia]|uniref:VasL domain-containing protein n=1 Tax=Lelliottia wanjuensis TaxID=3050585 RepID=A0AAP4D719_9ENTR|nr:MULTISPECIES: VasL domain-containing protein [unclassified Lelliottia]MDK9364660.1 VasL domain-containing protein [Lelliottia sp. V106_12]MDK9583864.1 VasL domain-containing protein [Lelliottia sp. V86_10]MDK9617556.1 VasL domain-containing protein [Lelliottia sp. V106_9]
MNTLPRQNLKTGSDPRSLADFIALRDEISKLTHPARPDVDWHRAEQLSLALFRQNGVELQTCAWYTLARTRTSGLQGLNEGLSILAALVRHQWGAVWPPQAHARMDILSNLVSRLQQVLRGLHFQYADLGLLYQIEQRLGQLCDTLQQLELKHLSQFDTLRTLIHAAAARLESMDSHGDAGGLSSLSPAMSNPPVLETTLTPSTQFVYVVDGSDHSLPPVPHGRRRWGAFITGALTMALIGGGGQWGVKQWQQRSLDTRLMATVQALPVVLSDAEQKQLIAQQPDKLTSLATPVLTATRQQLDQVSPLWGIYYRQQLVQQALTLWPESKQTKALTQAWQQQLTSEAASEASLNDWHQAQERLQQLTAQLNALDGVKGRYITGSELKTQVFAIRQSLERTPPLEELLRQLEAQQKAGEVPAAQMKEIERRLEQLVQRYTLIRGAGGQ